jgi:hypothetical protein
MSPRAASPRGLSRRLFCAALLALAGCAGIAGAPPPTPTPAQISAYAETVAGVNAAPADYLATGVAIANNACGDYFNGLTQQANDLGFAGQETNLAGGVASGALGLTGAGTAATAFVGLAVPALTQSLANAAARATGGMNPAAAFTLVKKAQSAYLAATPMPATKMAAAMALSGYAQLCQPAQVNAFVMQSTLNATASVTPGPTPAPAPAAAAFAPAGVPPLPYVSMR